MFLCFLMCFVIYNDLYFWACGLPPMMVDLSGNSRVPARFCAQAAPVRTARSHSATVDPDRFPGSTSRSCAWDCPAAGPVRSRPSGADRRTHDPVPAVQGRLDSLAPDAV